jgi:pimeloyl-ACP methyl ester carboxylesterase
VSRLCLPISVAIACLLASPAAKSEEPATSGVIEERVFEPFFQGEAYVLEAGREHERTVVLVHGVGDAAARDWDSVIPELAKTHHVVAFDLPGFGRSTHANELYSPLNLAAFVRFVVDERVHGPFTLVGHSLGGAVALRYAATFPAGLEQLVLVDAVGILRREAYVKEVAEDQLEQRSPAGMAPPGLSSLLANAMPRLVPDDGVVGSAASRRKLLGADPARIAGLALMLEDYSKLLDRVRVPTVLIWGSDDAIAPVRTGKTLSYVLPGARLEVIERCGHVPMKEAPERFNAILRDALEHPGPVLPAPVEPLVSERDGRCQGEHGTVFRGDYGSIEISDCSRVLFEDVRARSIVIRRSSATLENVKVAGDGPALAVEDSQLVVTGGSFEGEVAISASRSDLDVAGATLYGRREALVTTDRASFLFSLSRIRGEDGDLLLHGPRTLAIEPPPSAEPAQKVEEAQPAQQPPRRHGHRHRRE